MTDEKATQKDYPVDIDIGLLRVFLAVSETRNMTQAAEKLNLTQSAVSAAIRRLEESFDVSLIDRSVRPMRLTSCGRILRERAQEEILLSERIARELRDAKKGELLDIRLGYSDSISSIFGPFIAQNLIADVGHFAAYSTMTPRVTQMLLEHSIDIGINTDLVGAQETIQSIPICTEKFLIVAPDSHREKLKTWKDITELAKALTPIRYNHYCQSYIEIERLLRRLGVEIPSRIETDSNRMILSLVSRGYGWSIVPVLAFEQAYREFHHVCFREIELAGAERTTNVIFQKVLYEKLAQQIALKMKVFIEDEVISHLKAMDENLPKALYLH